MSDARTGSPSNYNKMRSLIHEPLEGRQLMAADLMALSDIDSGTTSYVAESFTTFTDNNSNGALDAGDGVSLVTADGTVDLVFGTDAFDSIEAAVDAAASGDRIVILPGTYAESLDTTTAGKDLTVQVGGDLPGAVVLDGSLRMDEGDTLIARAHSDTSADQLIVKEAVAILGAALEVLEGEEPQGSVVRVIDNQGSSAIEGQFSNVSTTPSGRSIISGSNWTITTEGGTGNDIILDSKTPVIVTAELIKDVTDSLELNTPLSVSGNMSFAGSDYDRLTFTFKSVTSPSIGSFGFTAADPETSSVKWEYRVDNSYFKHLKAGSEMSRVYSVSVRDESDLSNILLDEVRVTIVIRGINDAPVANDYNGDVDEDGKLESIPLPFTDPDNGDSHLFELGFVEGQPETKGIVSVDATGKFTYDPNGAFDYLREGETAQDYFTYTVTDSNGEEGALSSRLATAVITVHGKNSSPVAEDIAFTVDEDDAGSPRPFQFTDVDSDEFTFEIDTSSLSTRGEVVNHGNGEFTYIPAGYFDSLQEGETALDQFVYTVIDADNNRVSATVSVDVEGLNDQPLANDQELTVAEDGTIAEQAFDVDFVDAGDESEHVFTINPEGTDTTLGTVSYLGEGKFSYTPGEAFSNLLHESAFDSFTYTVTDPQTSVSRVATVTIEITPVNNAPIASDVELTVAEGQISDITQLLVDLVDDGDEHTYEFFDADGQPVANIINLEDGTFQFDATTGFEGLFSEDYTTELTYKVTDAGNLSSTAKILITVTAVDSVPKASDVELTVAENSEATEIEFVIDFVDEGDEHVITIDDGSGSGERTTIGEIVSLGDNRYSYSPAGRFNDLFGENGSDSFTYTVTDQAGNTATATVRINITPIDNAPIANDMDVTILEDSTGETWSVDVDLVDQGDSHTYSIVSVSGGSAEIDGEGNLTYSPNGEFESLPVGGSETAEIVYQVTDAAGNHSTATIRVLIQGENDAPVAEPLAVEVLDNSTVTGAVVASDIDAEDQLTYAAITEGTLGVVILNPDGTFSYDPAGRFDDLAPGEEQTDTFSYTVTDTAGASSTSTVSITIIGSDKSPSANADSYSTAVNTTLSIPATFGLLANDTGFKGASIWLTGISAGGNFAGVGQALELAHGNIVVQADGSFTYMPTMYSAGTDEFTYTVTDGVYTSTATATISILGMNNPPIAIADYAITGVGQPIIVDVMFNDFDQDSDSLTLNRVRGIPVSGEVSAITMGGGTFTVETDDFGYSRVLYTPSSTFVGIDQFSYIVADGRGGFAGAEVYVHVRGDGGIVNPSENNPPVARDDAYTLGNNAQLALNVFANDSDSDSPAQTLTIESITVGDQTIPFVAGESFAFEGLGTLQFTSSTGDTNFNFQPEATATGLIEFSYTINDGNGGTSTANVSIELKSANQTPEAVADVYESLPGELLIVDAATGVSSNDVDAENDTLSVTLMSQPVDEDSQPAGYVSLMEDGSFVYIPAPGFEGNASFTYRVTDGNGGWSTGTVQIVTKSGETESPTPILSGTDFEIPEGSLAETPVGAIVVTGLTGSEFDFAIESTDENLPFVITPTGEIVVGNDVTIDTLDYETQNEYTFTVVLNYGDSQSVTHEVTVRLTDVDEGEEGEAPEVDPTTAPRVTSISVKNSAWSAEFQNYLVEENVSGVAGAYLMPTGASQATILPWLNLNEIIVEFDQDVSESIDVINQVAFSLSGVMGQNEAGESLGTIPGISTVSVVGNIATLTLERGLVGSQVSLSIHSDNVKNVAGLKLDGEWNNNVTEGPSGDGIEGGDLVYTFNVLPGDVNGDGVVDSSKGIGSESDADLANRLAHGFDVRPEFDGITDIVVAINNGTHELDKYSPYRDLDGGGVQGATDVFAMGQFNGSKL